MVLLSFLAACNENDLPGGEPDNSLVTLQISNLQRTDTEEAATRAATAAYPTTGSIGFFVKASTGYIAQNNIKGTYYGTPPAWQPAANEPIWLNNNNATVAVYAPYDTGQTTAAALKLNAALRTDDTKDIWYTRVTDANFKKSSLSLTLTHVYARCIITVKRAASYLPDAQITGLSLAGTGVYSNATFKLLEASPYDYTGATTGFTPSGLGTKTLNSTTSSVSYDLLLIPASLSGSLTLTLTVSGNPMKLTLAATKFSGKFEAGKQYGITVTLRPGELAASATVEQWSSTSSINGETAEYQ